MTSTEKAIRDFCGHHADWWPSVSQVQEMLSFAQPCKTCEALARTVMMDQTSHDATPPAQPATVQEPVAWAEEIIADLHALYDSEMITENDSGDALIRLEAAVCAVEEAEQRHTTPPAAQQEPRCAVIVEVFGKDWRLDYMSLPVGKHRLYTQEYVYTTPPAAQPAQHTEQELYHELLFAVAKVHPNETRHQTALRYIQQAESGSADRCTAAHGIKERNT